MKPRRLFVSQYQAGAGTILPHQILATTIRGARDLAELRGLGEQVFGLCVEPKPACSQVWMSRTADTVARFHAIAFLGLLAMASGAAQARDFFDDDIGILHLACHLEEDRRRPLPRRGTRGAWRTLLAQRHLEIVARIRAIEKRIPGYGA